MENMSYLKMFNKVVDEFLIELMELFPENNKIKVQYSLFQTLVKSNARKVPNDFMINSIPYLEKICMKDITFFQGSDNFFLTRIGFETIWPELSENTKEKIWIYLKTLFSIGSQIIELPQETIPFIEYIKNNL
jgi:hypothetical protein